MAPPRRTGVYNRSGRKKNQTPGEVRRLSWRLKILPEHHLLPAAHQVVVASSLAAARPAPMCQNDRGRAGHDVAPGPDALLEGLSVLGIRLDVTPLVDLRSGVELVNSGFAPVPTATMHRSQESSNSEPFTGTGRRRPEASGSPSSILMHSMPVRRPFSLPM